MRRRPLLLASLLGTLTAVSACTSGDDEQAATGGSPGTPLPTLQPAAMSLSAALARRRSTREYADGPLAQQEVGQLLWAAQGVSSTDGRRTAPSAGALYPLTVSVALPDGLYRYAPAGHQTARVAPADLRRALADAALHQTWLGTAAAVFAISGDLSRTARRYGARAQRYVLLEAGHAAQNLLLQAVALGLSAAPVGSFDDDALHDLLQLPRTEQAIYLLPVGRSRVAR